MEDADENHDFGRCSKSLWFVAGHGATRNGEHYPAREAGGLLSLQEYDALTQGKADSWAQSSTTELLAAFRGSGKGGGTARLVAEREAERQREA